MEGKFKNFSAWEIRDYIKQHKAKDDDEWLEIEEWVDEFLKSDAPEEEKKLFTGLGYGEVLCIICDGIKRWRSSICIRCKKTTSKYSCEIYEKKKDHTNGIPAEIWAHEDAECPYYEPRE